VPPILHVCRETRSEFTRRSRPSHYELIPQRSGEKGHIYIDWAADEVFIPWGCMSCCLPVFRILTTPETAFPQNELGLRPCWVEGSLHKGMLFLKRFLSLKTIILVVSFGRTQANDCRQLRKMENPELRRIATLVLLEFRSERGRDSVWEPPQLRVVNSRQSRLHNSESH
jgi:hypothetical protein